MTEVLPIEESVRRAAEAKAAAQRKVTRERMHPSSEACCDHPDWRHETLHGHRYCLACRCCVRVPDATERRADG